MRDHRSLAQLGELEVEKVSKRPRRSQVPCGEELVELAAPCGGRLVEAVEEFLAESRPVVEPLLGSRVGQDGPQVGGDPARVAGQVLDVPPKLCLEWTTIGGPPGRWRGGIGRVRLIADPGLEAGSPPHGRRAACEVPHLTERSHGARALARLPQRAEEAAENVRVGVPQRQTVPFEQYRRGPHRGTEILREVPEDLLVERLVAGEQQGDRGSLAAPARAPGSL